MSDMIKVVLWEGSSGGFCEGRVEEGEMDGETPVKGRRLDALSSVVPNGL